MIIKSNDHKAMPFSPPPQSPSPVLETTTIGKYISRFRYEKPQPRKSRVAAQRGDFWWTKSPRHSCSPSSLSTRTSGNAFAFSDTDDEDTIDTTKQNRMEEEEWNLSIEEDGESVESKLRQRMGLFSSKLSEHKKELELENSRTWGCMDLESFDLDVEEEDVDMDPEDVIERVRRRLGWNTTMSGNGFSNASRPKPPESQLSIASRTDLGCQQLETKPQSSTALRTEEEIVYKSTSSIKILHQAQEYGAGEDDRLASCKYDTDVKIKSVVENDEKEKLLSITESVAQLEGDHGHVSFGEQSKLLGLLPTADLAVRKMELSSSTVFSQVPKSGEALDSAFMIPPNNSLEESSSATLPHRNTLENNITMKGRVESLQSPHQRLQHDALCAMASPSFQQIVCLEKADLAPKLTYPTSYKKINNVQAHDLHSTDTRDESISVETTETLNNLVSLVVHSWENTFLSSSKSEESELLNNSREQIADSGADMNCHDDANDKTASFSVNLPLIAVGDNKTKEVSDGAQAPRMAKMTTEDTCEDTSTPIKKTNHEPTRTNKDDEKIVDDKISEEDTDPIVQMLRDRIFLLEEALRQIDR